MKFRSVRYPKLKVRLPNGKYVRFVDGELDTNDKAVIDVLKQLPEDRGVKAAGGRVAAKGEAKSEDAGAPDQGDEK